MSEDEDGDATDGIERTQQEHGTRRTEAKYRPVLRHHHECLQAFHAAHTHDSECIQYTANDITQNRLAHQKHNAQKV